VHSTVKAENVQVQYGTMISIKRFSIFRHTQTLHVKRINFITNDMELTAFSVVIQPLQIFPTCYITQRVITVFTRGHHLSLYSARWIHSTHHPILFSILISSPHLYINIPSGSFLQVFLQKPCTHFSPMHAICPAHLLMTWSFWLYLVNSTSYEAPHYASG
jgi:hypothetical protein